MQSLYRPIADERKGNKLPTHHEGCKCVCGGGVHMKDCGGHVLGVGLLSDVMDITWLSSLLLGVVVLLWDTSSVYGILLTYLFRVE
ncbi:hypothetical protein ACSBR2_008709 [Camellia fascicularis]